MAENNKKSAHKDLIDFKDLASKKDIERIRPFLKGLEDFTQDKVLSVFTRSLPWYFDVRLLQAKFDGELLGFGHYFLADDEQIHFLDGESTAIHNFNDLPDLSLSKKNVLLYLNFFCYFVHGEEGPFLLIKTYDDLNLSDTNDLSDIVIVQKDEDIEPGTDIEKFLTGLIVKPVVKSIDDGWEVVNTIQYGELLFNTTFKVAKTGNIEMLDDEPLVGELLIDESKNSIQFTPPPRFSFTESDQELVIENNATNNLIEQPAHLAFIRRQLVVALRESELQINSKTDDEESVLKSFIEYMEHNSPVVIICSDTPFCEQLVHRVLYANGMELRATLPENIPGSGVLRKAYFNPSPIGSLTLLSLHKFSKVSLPKKFTIRLSSSRDIALIGTPSIATVQDPIRRITNLTLTFKPLDVDQFKLLFSELIGLEWQSELDDKLGFWIRFLQASDFYSAIREGRIIGDSTQQEGYKWDARIALEKISLSVQKRISASTPTHSPKIEDIHGMGSAKTIIQDLIIDIQDALSGKINWNEVDRGVLLVGPPGVGKTMLARATAKSCGVRFINASVSQWTSVSNWGRTIQCVRETFAQARLFAPCILFIDELDSVGNRNKFSGNNKQLSVELVNVLLEEIQGFDSSDPIFVIGATNHVDDIDPALRRAGRLDQVITIEHPSVEAIAEIFSQYLMPYMEKKRVSPDVEVDEIALMALGSTGAEIEFFVRDAARRARKEESSITKRHLTMAITRAPRSWLDSDQPSMNELRTTAIHEAGHCVAAMVCDNFPITMTVVSVIPRSNGSAGFTGFVKKPHCLATRQGYISYLTVLLAGRAAEEIIYGEENITAGSGGNSSTSDLALATSMAKRMLCHLGYSQTGIAWAEKLSSKMQIEEIEKILDSVYQSALALIKENKALIEEIANKLEKELEMPASDLLLLAEAHNLLKQGGVSV